MITLGIDLASQPARTAAAAILWEEGRARLVDLRQACTDDDLDALIATADAIGIDAPLGWPLEFIASLNDWPHREWTTALRDRLRFRHTDRFVHTLQGRWPLSVSTDTISLPGLRALALLCRHGVADRSGREKFFEVYPAASLRAWEIPGRGYKNADDPACLVARNAILQALRRALPALDLTDDCAHTSDTIDSVIAALTVRAAVQGRSHPPPSEHRAAAAREGWIHIPTALPSP